FRDSWIRVAEERILRRGRWGSAGQIRYGHVECDARAALHLRLRVAARAIDLCRVAVQRGVAARALELTWSMHRGHPQRVHAGWPDREIRVAVGHGGRSAPAVRVALQARASVVGSRGVLDENAD